MFRQEAIDHGSDESQGIPRESERVFSKKIREDQPNPRSVHYPGPKLSRADLVHVASGKIS
jgi:hypothetical protein